MENEKNYFRNVSYSKIRSIAGRRIFTIYNIISIESPKSEVRKVTGILQSLYYKGMLRKYKKVEFKVGKKRKSFIDGSSWFKQQLFYTTTTKVNHAGL